MSSLLDPTLQKTLAKDKQALEETELPIVTVSATFREDLKGWYGYGENESIRDVVFSRAHYSMALGIAVQAWLADEMPQRKKLSPAELKQAAQQIADVSLDQLISRHDTAWVYDPTNYVSMKDWRGVQVTELIGKTLARQPLLKQLKDWVDRFGRNKMPILQSITPPLLEATANVNRPILSLHIVAGNVLAAQGKTVVQVITDPHVRDEYVTHIDKPNFYLCTFDENTRFEVLEKAALLGIEANPNHVIVTGPPIDPRVNAAACCKRPWRNGPIKLCITTGGLGTNKPEIRRVLTQLLPELHHQPSRYQILVYAGTHRDIYQEVLALAEEAHITPGALQDETAPFRVIHHPQIVDANELLIHYGFPWADGFISKPSGDMAYDAVASGSFLLTVSEWGEWEFHVREVMSQLGVARQAEVDQILIQLEALSDASGKAESWVESAMQRAQNLPALFTDGAQQIIETYQKIAKGR